MTPPKPVLSVLRTNYHSDCIIGVVRIDDEDTDFVSMELPWTGDNAVGKSPIPRGAFAASWEPHDYSGRFKKTGIYRLAGVPGREGVLIHVANRAKKELRGCIAIGLGTFQFDDCLGIRSSTLACKRLFERLQFGDIIVRVLDDEAHETIEVTDGYSQ